MILKYRRRAKWMLFTMCFLIIAKFGLSIILSGFKDTLGGAYDVLNIIDAVIIISLVPVVLSGVFLTQYWYGRSKGLSSGETISTMFSVFGFMKLISTADRSVEKTGNDQPTKTQ